LEKFNGRLETYKQALETYDFHLSISKTKYVKRNFNNKRNSFFLEVKVGYHIIPKVTLFKYLGSIVQNDEEMEEDVNHRIQTGLLK